MPVPQCRRTLLQAARPCWKPHQLTVCGASALPVATVLSVAKEPAVCYVLGYMLWMAQAGEALFKSASNWTCMLPWLVCPVLGAWDRSWGR